MRDRQVAQIYLKSYKEFVINSIVENRAQLLCFTVILNCATMLEALCLNAYTSFAKCFFYIELRNIIYTYIICGQSSCKR